jgi:hypothetical protein
MRGATLQDLPDSMNTDSLLASILLFRCETQLLFDLQPSVPLRNMLHACDAALKLFRKNRHEVEARDVPSLMKATSN